VLSGIPRRRLSPWVGLLCGPGRCAARGCGWPGDHRRHL